MNVCHIERLDIYVFLEEIKICALSICNITRRTKSIITMKYIKILINVYLCGFKRKFGLQPILMHNPIGFLSFRGSSPIENQSLFHPDQHSTSKDLFILSCGFPITSLCSSVCSETSWILSISQTEKIPFFFPH